MIIIPARLNSTRFANKVLADIDGKPMFVQTALKAKEIDDVVIATDSAKIISEAKKFSFEAVLTSPSHNSGTERINEAVDTLGLKDEEIVLNLQADEPFIEQEVIQKCLNVMKKVSKEVDILSCYNKIDKELAKDENIVKVVLDNNNNAIYFSRLPIAFRSEVFNAHIGLYTFSVRSLKQYCSNALCDLEKVEKLEQLRALFYNQKIHMIEVNTKSFGIDTKEDLARAKKMFL